MSFYQSEVRQTIQDIIYQKPTFSINLFGKDYFWTIKTKKIGFFTLKRYQILGVELPEDPETIKKEIKKIKKEFWDKKSNIFFQLWVTNEIISFDIKDFINNDFWADLRENRIFLRNFLNNDYSLQHAFRENMPESGIIYDITKTDEELISEMNKASKDRVKKWIKNNTQFEELDEKEYDIFFDKRQETAGKKWFNTIPKTQYLKLINFLREYKQGNIFVSKYNDEILAGAICIYYKKSIVCLYSFADRQKNNVGGQQYMKFKIFTRGREHGFTTCDMMWWAPTGFPEHELASVSAFKESMGGIKTEYYGNYDIVLQSWIYKFFKRYYSRKK